MRIAVTGATGNVGSPLLARLLDRSEVDAVVGKAADVGAPTPALRPRAGGLARLGEVVPGRVLRAR
ncbi:MAG TPA: hypothetical protein VNU26_03390 [Mycobacteriales bacterium]|nr:hypothetical protein [Mycobacteriales bacterium]